MFYYNYSKTSFYERLDVRLVYGFFYATSLFLELVVLESAVLGSVVLALVVLRCLFGLGSTYVASSSLIESAVSSVDYFFTVSFLGDVLLVVFLFVERSIGGGGF